MDTSLPTSSTNQPAVAWPHQLHNIKVAIVLMIPFLIMSLITKLDFRLIVDEGLFHIKIIESFADEWPMINVADYLSASTPLSYILMTVVGKAVGFDIWKLRLLSAAATFLAAYIFHGICKRRNLPHPLLSSLIFLLFPYVFFFGFTIYPEAIGLFFGMWALSYYLVDHPSPIQLFKGSVLAALAVMCRQSFLVIPAGMLIYETWRIVRHGLRMPSRQEGVNLLLLGVPILVFLPFLLVWGGFTPPLNRVGQGGVWFIKLEPRHISYIVMLVGFYFIPALISSDIVERLRSGKIILITAVAFLLLLLLFPITSNYDPYEFSPVGGLIIRGIYLVERGVSTGAAFISMTLLWFAGVLVIASAWPRPLLAPENRSIIFISITFLALILLTPYVYERYYGLLVPLLILIFHRLIKSRNLLLLWLSVQVMISIGFSIWQISIK